MTPISLPHTGQFVAIVIQPGARISAITSRPPQSGPNLNTTPDESKISEDSISLNFSTSRACEYPNSTPGSLKVSFDSLSGEVSSSDSSVKDITLQPLNVSSECAKEIKPCSSVSSSSHLPITSFMSPETLNFLAPSPKETAVLLSLLRIDHALMTALKGDQK